MNIELKNKDYLEVGPALARAALAHAQDGQAGRSKSSAMRQYDVVDFFAGCGGMSYGFQLVGKQTGLLRHVASFDIDKYANQTFSENFHLAVSDMDLGAAAIADIKKFLNENGRNEKNGLIVIGCAPCQGFSAHRKKDPRKDSRNTLVGRFAEIATALEPEVIIMENVPELLSERHGKHYRAFETIVEGHGYNIQSQVVNMAYFGTPQKRNRAIVVAAKNIHPSIPAPFLREQKFRTVFDAIGHLENLSAGQTSPNDPMHQTSRHRESTIEIIRKVPKNGGFRPAGVGPKCLDRVKGFSDVYGRLFWEKPAVTITARCRTPSCGRFVHPDQDRGLSIREAALLQGFPESFQFFGPFDDKFKQIGNAVSPIFSTFLAAHICTVLQDVDV
ncbi:MAG: DNA cytosine methyltransferase [Kiritimatiellaeota bacterium]|nr:DNA cytosine methyltransferase [Kiritimatiellota bacterium]